MHMPLSIRLLSAHHGFQGASVERGLNGTTPGSPPAFVAMCHFLFTSAEDFPAAFLPHAEVLQGDMPNYTDIGPVIQFNELLVAQSADARDVLVNQLQFNCAGRCFGPAIHSIKSAVPGRPRLSNLRRRFQRSKRRTRPIDSI
jgi:uncharacterized protein (TIGR02118 family)